jgi:hypothetical protein
VGDAWTETYETGDSGVVVGCHDLAGGDGGRGERGGGRLDQLGEDIWGGRRASARPSAHVALDWGPQTFHPQTIGRHSLAGEIVDAVHPFPLITAPAETSSKDPDNHCNTPPCPKGL